MYFPRGETYADVAWGKIQKGDEKKEGNLKDKEKKGKLERKIELHKSVK
jgi:hypothetical protein